jgi:hypothetical protein
MAYYEIKKPPAARGLFSRKPPPGPPQKLLINFIRLRAREPRPYLDKNKQIPNSPECLVGAKCQGRGGVSPPDISEILDYIYNFKNRLNYCK